MFAADLYFDTDLSIPQQLELLAPLLRKWIGDDFERYYRADTDYFSYRPEEDFLISIERNSSYGQGIYDNDRFRYSLGTIDSKDKYSRKEHLVRMTAALKLFWSNGIPTCTPGKADELPNSGGENGPVPWPHE